MTDLPVKWGMGDFKKWGGDPSNGGMILKWGGVDTTLRTMRQKKNLTIDFNEYNKQKRL